jgi:hypothetical protein
MELIMPKSIADGAALIIAEAALAISEGKLGRNAVRKEDQEPADETPVAPPAKDARTERA